MEVDVHEEPCLGESLVEETEIAELVSLATSELSMEELGQW
jgi:hypothetical protein